MSTFGYAFRPWDPSKAIADGPSILRYLAETAKEYGVDSRIRFGCKVVPWRMNQNYALDVMALRFSAIDDGALEFRRRETGSRAA